MGKREPELVKSRRSANIAALHALAEQYPEQYRALQRVELEKRGFEQEPTPEEKAEQRLQEILREYPDLGVKFNLGPASDSQTGEIPTTGQ